MDCPHCASTATKERAKNTSLGYRTFCCSACKRTFNERTGTLFNYLEYPTDIVYGLGTSSPGSPPHIVTQQASGLSIDELVKRISWRADPSRVSHEREEWREQKTTLLPVACQALRACSAPGGSKRKTEGSPTTSSERVMQVSDAVAVG
jgi:hypothetical protein